MSEVLASSFALLPYRHGAIPETHPARLAAIARLLGQNAAAPDRCQVLELGCAGGMNVLPLAERFPASRFVGVDFSPEHIAMAEEARRAAGLENVQFVCADIRALLPVEGKYDYVIAHGVYSWVSEEVRDRLLALCARALAPDGVAYLSYNVYPGCGMIGVLRAMLRSELARVPDPVVHLGKLLPVLERAFASQPGPYAVLMRELLADMATRPPEMVFHDELETINDPVTFLDFIAHGERHGLHYLAEAHFASLPYEHLGLSARQTLADLEPDFYRRQQFLDLLGNRRFRNSLLIRGTPPDSRAPDALVIPHCAVALYLRPDDGRIDLAPGVPLRLTGRHGFQLSVSASGQKAFFAALCEAAPARLPFAGALARAAELLNQTGQPSVIDPEPLAIGLAKLFAADQCDLMWLGAGDWLTCSPNPVPSALMRFQARSGLHVTNRWHDIVELSADERRWVAGEAPAANETALIRTGLAV